MDRISLISITYRIFASVPLLTLTAHKDKIIKDEQTVHKNVRKIRYVTQSVYRLPNRSCNPAKREDWYSSVTECGSTMKIVR
jgi:hypothetical protein